MITTIDQPLILANLLHLSFNMWHEADAPPDDLGRWYYHASPKLRFEENLWRELTQRMADGGLNMVVLDLGDAIRYESHPEIAVEDAWSPRRLREEARRLRDMGLELIPKLNFSACHDEWMGPYARCVSTPAYYQVCKDLIAEVIDILEQPRFFHLGMDEETASIQKRRNYVIVRQHELIWHDLLFLIEQVQRCGVRPWMWSDLIWRHEEQFLKHVPRSVLQSNWYYWGDFEFKETEAATPTSAPHSCRVHAYHVMEAAGYDQIPTCSNHNVLENTARTLQYCPKWLSREHLKGFMQTDWRPMIAQFRDCHLQAIDLLAQAAAKDSTTA